MIRQIYTVLDRAVLAHGTPIFTRARGEAVRSFMDECKNPDSMLSKHPEHYEMYFIGTYNEETAELTPHEPERVAMAIDFVTPRE